MISNLKNHQFMYVPNFQLLRDNKDHKLDHPIKKKKKKKEK